MNYYDKAHTLALLLKTKLTWNWRNTRYVFAVDDNPKFMGPRAAVKLIPDGAVVATSGLAANQRPSIMYWAMRELFEETGHPCNLTVVGTGGQGGRGRVPGTVEELGVEGLCTRLITGHLETYRSLLRLGAEGKADLECLPQGIIALLFEALGAGEETLLSRTGVGTFLDPRVGHGSVVAGKDAEQLVAVESDGLRYRLPRIDVAVFNGYAADIEGNIYMTHCPMLAEGREIVRAAKRNGGRVLVNVSRVVEKGFDEVFVSGDMVDAVVVYPWTEQSGYIPYHKQLDFLTRHTSMSLDEGVARARFINQVMGITPRRSAADVVVARLAARVFAENVSKGALVNVGVGLPEEVCRIVSEGPLFNDITLFTESGVVGGVPAPGFFFGAGVGAREIVSSAEIFHRVYERLDTAILGVLQADGAGNVNVSKRGDDVRRYVGPGGFIDLTTAAKTVVFVTKWMERARVAVRSNRIRIVEPGKPKFVPKVDEITFCGPEAVKAGKKIFFATTVGVFRLTARGMELTRIMPGIDLRRDILDVTAMPIVLPESGDVPLVELPL